MLHEITPETSYFLTRSVEIESSGTVSESRGILKVQVIVDTERTRTKTTRFMFVNFREVSLDDVSDTVIDEIENHPTRMYYVEVPIMDGEASLFLSEDLYLFGERSDEILNTEIICKN